MRSLPGAGASTSAPASAAARPLPDRRSPTSATAARQGWPLVYGGREATAEAAPEPTARSQSHGLCAGSPRHRADRRRTSTQPAAPSPQGRRRSSAAATRLWNRRRLRGTGGASFAQVIAERFTERAERFIMDGKGCRPNRATTRPAQAATRDGGLRRPFDNSTIAASDRGLLRRHAARPGRRTAPPPPGWGPGHR